MFSFSIDRGGTFTDVHAILPDGSERVLKLLSEDPKNYPDAPREGIRRILEAYTGQPHPRDKPVPTTHISSIRMGTTVATNALLERKGSNVCLLVTKGFKDILHIGTQARPRIFDLEIRRPSSLYSEVIEVDERVILEGSGATTSTHPSHATSRRVTGTTGEVLIVERELDESGVRQALINARSRGVTSCAIAFLHSYTWGEHELKVASIAQSLGFTHVSCSHAIMPAVKIVPRGHTACADAYLSPVVSTYLQSFAGGFEGGLGWLTGPEGEGGRSLPTPSLLFMQSDGGLCDARSFSGFRSILSGPAGGCVGYAKTTAAALLLRPLSHQLQQQQQKHLEIVAFDMGGTSTDVSRYSTREGWEHVQETVTGGVSLCAPQLDINTVAAGGGSVLEYREDGMLSVGPESVGAHPGPICYRKGGTRLAVTDANVALGRIIPSAFPAIFGPTEDAPLDAAASVAAFEALAAKVAAATAGSAAAGATPLTPDTLAAGFLAVANEAMCRPIRQLTQMRGHDLTRHVMACFGGAGPQHACAVAGSLGVRRVFISKYAGVLSAYGLALADIVCEVRAPLAHTLVVLPAGKDEVEEEGVVVVAVGDLGARFKALALQALEKLTAQGASVGDITLQPYLNIRYQGTDSSLHIPCWRGGDSESGSGSGGEVGEGWGFPASALLATAAAAAAATASWEGGVIGTLEAAIAQSPKAFIAAYRKEFGFTLKGRAILAEDMRVRGVAKGGGVGGGSRSGLSSPSTSPAAGAAAPGAPPLTSLLPPTPDRYHSVYFEGLGRVSTPLHQVEVLRKVWGKYSPVPGPAILLDNTSTIVVEVGWEAETRENGDVILNHCGGNSREEGEMSSRSISTSTPTTTTTLPASTLTPSPVPIPPSKGPLSPPSGERAPTDFALSRWEDSPVIAWTPAASSTASALVSTPCDPIALSIFAHRFMGIAEQCGRTLQRTSVSVNMRERLDYSCALFGPDGGLIANAPHIPVHLGAMTEAVRCQLRWWGGDLHPGDVLLSNHPQLAGGSHLPDMTVITPVWSNSPSTSPPRIIFFLASRGHHSDVGGITPGSMPPHSTSLAQEGCAIVAHKLVSIAGGGFDEVGTGALLAKAGARNIPDVLSDLAAQVAANHRGVTLMGELIEERGLGTVTHYMHHIQAAAEGAVRAMFKRFAAGVVGGGSSGGGSSSSSSSSSESNDSASGVVVVRKALDRMDDGTPIALTLSIDGGSGGAVFDFTGTGPQVFGNTNAPPAVTASAIIYCLRCLVGLEIPLNQGALAPCKVIIPPGSLLHPSNGAAVVGGNVLTSQRVVDVILRAFGACGASSGCMNNLTFGDGSFGFYETIGGGAGGGPGWEGASGVHTHMTNTRITDAEVLERRYPVILRAFTLREGGGGEGQWRGGRGILRELEFRAPLQVSILSERRAHAPYGLYGGGEGGRGVNTLIRGGDRDGLGTVVNLGGKASFAVVAGDRLRVETPGGGGYGSPTTLPIPSTTPSAAIPFPRASGSLAAHAETENDF